MCCILREARGDLTVFTYLVGWTLSPTWPLCLTLSTKATIRASRKRQQGADFRLSLACVSVRSTFLTRTWPFGLFPKRSATLYLENKQETLVAYKRLSTSCLRAMCEHTKQPSHHAEERGGRSNLLEAQQAVFLERYGAARGCMTHRLKSWGRRGQYII